MKNRVCILIIALIVLSASAAGVAAEAVPGKKIDEPPAAEKREFWDTLFSLDPMKRKDPDEKHWYLTVGGWYERKFGNTDAMRANGSFNLEYTNGIARLVASYIQFYSESKNETVENTGSGLLKYDHYLISFMEFFVFNQSDYNGITGLRIRNSTGTGLKFVLLRNRFWTLDLSAAPLFEYERYTTEDYSIDYRASFRARVKINIMDWLYLNGTVYYVPRFEYFGDYRFIVDTSATLNVLGNPAGNAGVMLKAGYIRNYNTFAPPGKEKLDQFYYAQLEVRL